MSSGFKKTLFVIFALLFFFVLLPIVFYFATYPFVPKYFATENLKDFVLDFEKGSIQLTREEIPNCEHFVEERDSWRSDPSFLGSYGTSEQIEALFDRNWEEERECLYSVINKPNTFISTYRLKLMQVDAEMTDFKDEIDMIMYSFDNQLSYYFEYKRTIDEDIDARKGFYECRTTVSKNFDFDQFYEVLLDGTIEPEDFDITALDEGFEECGEDFEKKLRDLDLKYDALRRKILRENENTYSIVQELKKEIGVE